MKRSVSVLACLFLAAGATTASAQDDPSGWRIGGNAQTTNLKRDDGLVDDTQIGFKVFAQYRFNSWLGLEGAYDNTGELSSNKLSAGGSDVDLLYQGLMGQAVVYLPIPMETLDVFVKGGYYAFNIDSTIDGEGAGQGTDNGMNAGLGMSLSIAEAMAFRAEFDWFDASDADLWTFGLGLEYRF